MGELEEILICTNCGNIFSEDYAEKQLDVPILYQCPACKKWDRKNSKWIELVD